MPKVSDKGKKFYMAHGWTEHDIAYIEREAEIIEEGERWVMGIVVAPDGVKWLFPTSPGNMFPKTLWERIKYYIKHNNNIIIPMNQNFDLVEKAAKRYNGYLNDNLYMFGDELKGIQINKGMKP